MLLVLQVFRAEGLQTVGPLSFFSIFGDGRECGAGEFADEPCFSDLAGSVEEERFTTLAVKPRLKGDEKMSFHVLKIAVVLIFSKVVCCSGAFRILTGGQDLQD